MEIRKVLERVYDKLEYEARFFKFLPGYEYLWNNRTLIDLDDTEALADHFVQHHFVDPVKEDLEHVVWHVSQVGRELSDELTPPGPCINGIKAPQIKEGMKKTKKRAKEAHQWIKAILEHYQPEEGEKNEY